MMQWYLWLLIIAGVVLVAWLKIVVLGKIMEKRKADRDKVLDED